MAPVQQHRRVVVGTVFVFFLVAVLLLSAPSRSSVVRVPKFLTYKNTDNAANTDFDLTNQDFSVPVGTYTYDNIAKITGDLAVAMDPCEGLTLAEGGKSALKAQGTFVLVTGGAGFIGSNLVDRLLALGYKVRIFDNLYTGFIRNVPLGHENVEFFYGDILDRKALQEALQGIDYVFHLAAMSKVVPSLKSPDMARFCLESNALGSWNVLEEARLAGKIKKVVYAASSTYYGNAPPPHKENMAPDFLTPYASSKYEGEMQMQTFDQLFGVPTVSTRFFMVYGPRQPTTGAYAIVTGVFAKEAAEGKPLTIEGDGTHSRDFIHVTDIVEGLILAQQAPTLHGEVINLGTGTSYSVKDLADLVSKDQVQLPPRNHDLIRTLADTCKMKRLLNFQPKTDFIQAMSYMVKATKEGNVFIQDWFTLPRALSAPHLLPIGTPDFAWPKAQDDLDALLVSLQRVNEWVQSGAAQDRRLITVIPLSVAGIDALKSSMPALREMLLNTVHSLVRYGGVVRYMVAAADDVALQTCTELNLPCLDVRNSFKEGPALVDALLSRGFDVHYAVIGNSYVSSVISFMYNNGDESLSTADTIRAQSRGDFFVRVNDGTRRTFARMDKNKLDHQSMLNNEWPVTDLNEATFDVQYFCEGLVEHDTNPTREDISSSAESRFGDDHRLAARSSHTPCTGVNNHLYIAVGCEDRSSAMVESANATVNALIKSGGFHLSRCPDPEHCDIQQIVPSQWLRKRVDLKANGNLCA
ncbi:NAD dependent epimerase/dehydratase-like protein 2 [Elsinoe fawcettii]|nr:NAD dependent epimerase/dehydratase-like protein 2 [Elsinoe fawcettii]